MNIIETKNVIIRKPHNCWGCKRKFEKGKELLLVKCADNNTVYNIYWCFICDSYIQNNRSELDLDLGIDYGELVENEEELQKLIEKDNVAI